MESDMAGLGSCLSTKVTGDGKTPILETHQQRADLWEQGHRQQQALGIAQDPLVVLKGLGIGWGSLGPALTSLALHAEVCHVPVCVPTRQKCLSPPA